VLAAVLRNTLVTAGGDGMREMSCSREGATAMLGGLQRFAISTAINVHVRVTEWRD
jgi:hypothetical protein